MAPPQRGSSLGRIPKKSAKFVPPATDDSGAPTAKKPRRYATGVEPEAPTPESNAAAIKLLAREINRYNVIWKHHGIDPRTNSKQDIKSIVRNLMSGSMGLGGDHQCVRELDTIDFRGTAMVTKFATCTAAELLLANAPRLRNVGDGKIQLQKDKTKTELAEESSCKSLAFFATLSSDSHRFFMLNGPKIGSAPIDAPRDSKPLEVLYAGEFELKYADLIADGRIKAKADPKAMQKKNALLRQRSVNLAIPDSRPNPNPTANPPPSVPPATAPDNNPRDPRRGASQSQGMHRMKLAAGTGRHLDVLTAVARRTNARDTLLCFDEFQVTDIADAMVLKELFSKLFRGGLVVVATSNRPPDDLYLHGVMRSNFVPFIPVLKRHCEVVNLDSGVDYRLRAAASSELPYYFVEGDCDADRQANALFRGLAAKEGDVVRSRVMRVLGRQLSFERTCGRVLDVHFDELCGQPLGAADYSAIGTIFHTVVLRHVPLLAAGRLDHARRFITLVDVLYNCKTRLVCSAAAAPTQLFQPAAKDSIRLELADDRASAGAADGHSPSLGEEEAFAWGRTVSRLFEMQTDLYWSHRQPS